MVFRGFPGLKEPSRCIRVGASRPQTTAEIADFFFCARADVLSMRSEVGRSKVGFFLGVAVSITQPTKPRELLFWVKKRFRWLFCLGMVKVFRFSVFGLSLLQFPF